MKCEGQQVVTIYQNISRVKTGTQELSTVNKIHIDVSKSFIDQHPHAGNALELPIDYIDELPQLITFVVVHPRDKLILKYSPQQLDNTSMCPCALRDYNLKQFKTLHQNTAKEFSENFASCTFPDSGPHTLFPGMGERIVKIRMNAMFQ